MELGRIHRPDMKELRRLEIKDEVSSHIKENIFRFKFLAEEKMSTEDE